MNQVPGSPLVYVIVLTYRMREIVRDCLASLRLTYPNYRIVVVDNSSGDGTEEMLRRDFPALPVVQTGGNLGYTGGNNRGIDYAIGHGAEYVLILNPDTVVTNPAFLDEMVAYVEAHPEVGIAGPRVFLREAGIVQNTVLFPPGLWRNSINWVRYRVDPGSLEFSGAEVVESRVLNGVCLLIRVSCLRQIGLFDEQIFMYIEDAEMDYRALRQGWRVRYLPIDSVIHRQKLEGYGPTSTVNFLLKRNSVYYLRKIDKIAEAWGYAVISLLLLAGRALLTRDRAGFREHLRFGRRLIRAYRRILSGRGPDQAFGPPFAPP
ncbi:MAG TPA: glycosyltransferase family 2 protein [Blastocatellia bacterium]|nr:glycosyltransferase family 2 protein [Blastocatellia bacterium]